MVVMKKDTKKKSSRQQSIMQLLLLLIILVLSNILAGYLFTRIDMTQEKRYSLSSSSVELAKKLDDVVYFRIYLDGDLPPGLIRLRNSMKEMLDEFRVYAGDNIEYEFVDPSANPDETERVNLYKQLSQKGLYPTNLEENQKSGQSQKIIFPGALVNYRSYEVPMQLLKSKLGSSSEEMLNSSVESLEYEICSMIRKLTTERTQRVGFLQGQKELSTMQIADAANALGEFYKVDTIEIDEQLNALKDFKAIIIAGPDTAFTEKDKFILDQFVMHGGRVLWLVDQMQISMDSLEASSTNVAIPKNLNIDDMLFRYGVRINTDLVMDMQAAPIPIVTGFVGNQPKQEVFPWYYFPLISTDIKSPLVHNLNMIKLEFASTIDTIETDSVSKTVLLSTSKLSRFQLAPARVSLNILRDKPEPSIFNKRNLITGVLLEGKFTSAYKGRIPAQVAGSPEINYKERSEATKMIVVSDANIIENFISKKGKIFPLGYDRITQQTYGNRNFILNCVDYLCDNKAVLELRGKEFRIRLLDQAKIENPLWIQWLNLLLPPVLIIVFGLIFNYRRKKKFVL